MEQKLKVMCDISDQVLETLQKDIAEIKVALLGNEYNPHAGLLYRTTQLEVELNKLRAQYNRMIWTVAGAGAVIAIVVNLIMAFFDKFIIKAV
jgi:hypothetical protein